MLQLLIITLEVVGSNQLPTEVSLKLIVLGKTTARKQEVELNSDKERLEVLPWLRVKDVDKDFPCEIDWGEIDRRVNNVFSIVREVILKRIEKEKTGRRTKHFFFL